MNLVKHQIVKDNFKKTFINFYYLSFTEKYMKSETQMRSHFGYLKGGKQEFVNEGSKEVKTR